MCLCTAAVMDEAYGIYQAQPVEAAKYTTIIGAVIHVVGALFQFLDYLHLDILYDVLLCAGLLVDKFLVFLSGESMFMMSSAWTIPVPSPLNEALGKTKHPLYEAWDKAKLLRKTIKDYFARR